MGQTSDKCSKPDAKINIAKQKHFNISRTSGKCTKTDAEISKQKVKVA